MVWDSHQRGLAVVVQPTGHKAWKCVYPFHGRPRWYHIGNAAAIDLADARKLASRVMFKVAEGNDPAAERKAERGKGTFEDWQRATSRNTPSARIDLGSRRTRWFAVT